MGYLCAGSLKENEKIGCRTMGYLCAGSLKDRLKIRFRTMGYLIIIVSHVQTEIILQHLMPAKILSLFSRLWVYFHAGSREFPYLHPPDMMLGWGWGFSVFFQLPCMARIISCPFLLLICIVNDASSM